VLVVVLAIFAAVLPLVTQASAALAQGPAVVINEFLADNNNGLADNTGEFEDWIELHNTSTSSINLQGWTIADSDDVYTFENTSIGANGYLVIFASGDVSRSAGPDIHVPFKLSADGEPLLLRDSAGTLSSPSFPAPGYPALPTNVSYGRTPGGLGFFTSPTPGSSNNGASAGLVQPVTFSVPHGFYASVQSVTLDTATPSATIRYTLNGSTPTPTNGVVIAPGQSISVASTSTVRAIAYRSGWIPSTTETRTYLFTADILTQSESTPAGWPDDGAVNSQAFTYGMDPTIVNGNQAAVSAALTAIPSISIVTDQANLTNGSTGVYVNPTRTGRDWERAASVELIDPSGAEPGFDINAGLRVRGGGSRRTNNPKHSLRLYFRDDYGDGALEYPLFGPDGVDSFESLGLATGQNGSWQYRGEQWATWIRELWSRETQRAMGQPATDSRHYHVYLNGIYWGLYYSQERLSGAHGERHFGGNEDDYDVVGANWRSAGTASDGTTDGLKALYPIVQDLTVTASEFATLDAAIDLENLADYYLLHYYSGDFDGSPMGWSGNGLQQWSESNNWRAFRNRTGVGRAGKWLFYDHDSEIALCVTSTISVNLDNTAPWPNLVNGSVPNHQVVTPAWLHQALLTNPTYVQIFRDSVAEHMQTSGGALDPAVGVARVDELAARVSGAIDGEAARWGDSLGDPANDKSDWLSNVDDLRSCVNDRFAVVQGQLEADGLWPTTSPPVISPSAGAVPFGTDISIDTNGEPGTIWYTLDGSDPQLPTGAPSAAAIEYSGPVPLITGLTIRARVRDGSSWSPLGSASYSLSTPAGPVRLLLNEYNAVSGSKFLGGGTLADTANGTDATLGRVAGNGGDWFELVVLEDLDLRGWTFDIWHIDQGLLEQSASLTVANTAELADVEAGTIITVSEDIADDLSFDPTVNDWHINLQANNADQGAYFTAASQQNFAIDKDNTQIAIFDATNTPVALRTGEGTVAGVSVGSEEVFKLEGTPTSDVTFDSDLYQDGTSSTWGLPNVWANGSTTQNLDPLRLLMGDVTCDRRVSIRDALFIAQFTVGNRDAVASCPLDPATEILAAAADVNRSGSVRVSDALTIAQCSSGIPNVFCPEG